MTDWHLARGYLYAGVHSGLRPDPNRRDLSLIISDAPAAAAGVFTQNRVCAAPVQVCRERLPTTDARGVVICSGNANACTGQRGLDDARRMTAVAAESVGCKPEKILVCSTGVIGRHLPMPVIESGIQIAAKQLRPTTAALNDAAYAILTTDTRIKVSTREVRLETVVVRITGFAKGAAMIGPNMATMLAFVFTDASVAPDDLAVLTRRAADQSFNCVSVEGHTSTNDTLLLFANGTGPKLQEGDLVRYGQAVTAVCADLAKEIAADAEGASHFVTLDVEGLRDDAEARTIAKSIAEDALVKTAIFGADPNWGRIISAAGHSGVDFREEHLSLWLGDMLLYLAGTPQEFDAATASSYLKNNRDIHIRLRFTLGAGRCTLWTCDLTYEYVRLNADYTT
jgi:glutamate N-acetyltransferase/amino-acid N-acetyltransferase